MLLSALLMLLFYDACTAVAKYNEGFENHEGKIQAKRKSEYSAANMDLIHAGDLLFNLGCTLKTSAAFLLLSLFHFTFQASGDFISSRQFAMSRTYAVVSLVLYPLLQYGFSSDPLISGVLPQFLYNVEALMTVGLCQLANTRFRRLLANQFLTDDAKAHIASFTVANNWLTLASLLDVFGLMSMNIDIVSHQNNIRNAKLAKDVFSKLANTGFTMSFVVLAIMVFPKPRKQAPETDVEAQGNAGTAPATATTDQAQIEMAEK